MGKSGYVRVLAYYRDLFAISDVWFRRCFDSRDGGDEPASRLPMGI